MLSVIMMKMQGGEIIMCNWQMVAAVAVAVAVSVVLLTKREIHTQNVLSFGRNVLI